jgi:NTE family protein
MGRCKFNSILLAFFLLASCQKGLYFCHDPEPIPQPRWEKVDFAIVLGGGGARGLAHIGVLEELYKEGIYPDMIIGCSAGSIVGALYSYFPKPDWIYKTLVGVKRGDLMRINLLDSRFGISKGSGIRALLYNSLGDCQFSDLKIPFQAVATDLHTGELVVLGAGAVVPAVHASSAVPCVFHPVNLYGRVLVDGGVANPVPVAVAKEAGAKVIIAVDLCLTLDPEPPCHLFGIAKRSAEISHITLSKYCTEGADLVIKPKVGHFGLFDDSVNEHIYQAGKDACREAMPQIKELLKYCP